MIVGCGDNGVLMIGLVRSDVTELTAQAPGGGGGMTQDFEMPGEVNFLTRHVIVVYANTKTELIGLLEQGGVKVSRRLREDYFAGRRTDGGKKDH